MSKKGVYLLENPYIPGWVKIGSAGMHEQGNFRRRFGNYRTMTPHDVNILAWSTVGRGDSRYTQDPSSRIKQREKELKQNMDALGVANVREWYAATPSQAKQVMIETRKDNDGSFFICDASNCQRQAGAYGKGARVVNDTVRRAPIRQVNVQPIYQLRGRGVFLT